MPIHPVKQDPILIELVGRIVRAADDAERALSVAKKVEERVLKALHPPPN